MKKRKSVKEELLQHISTLKANERIPSRSFICTKWNISRSTADLIIAELQQEGVVYCVKGSGTFVSAQQTVEVPMGKPDQYHWAILVPDITFSLYPKAFTSIVDFSRKHNIDFIVCCSDDSAETEYALIQRAVSTGISGMIVIPARTTTENERNYQYLIRSGVPFVFWQRSVDYMREIPQFLLNGYYGGYLATRHLLDRGYRRVAYMAPIRFRSSMDRYMGYCAAMSEAGLEVDPKLVRIGIQPGEERSCIREMLSQPDPADGFVCFVDSLAVEVVKVAREYGLHISDDVGVIGFEGVISWLDATLDIRLTYVDISYEESGTAAAEVLWSMMMDRKAPDTYPRVFAPKLVVRDSCRGKLNGTVRELHEEHTGIRNAIFSVH